MVAQDERFALAQAAPGRFVFGVGTSSNVIVERWNDIPFDKPYERTRDVVRFLREALSGEKVTADLETFSVRGFKLGVPPPEPVPILVAALREASRHKPDDVPGFFEIARGAASTGRQIPSPAPALRPVRRARELPRAPCRCRPCRGRRPPGTTNR